MGNDASVLAATYTKLVKECQMARSFCEAKLDTPLRDCLYRIRAVLSRVNSLLNSTAVPALVSGIVALNNLATQTLQQTENIRSPESLDKALEVLLELRKLFHGFDKGGNRGQTVESAGDPAEHFAASRNGSSQEERPRASVVIPAYNMSRTLWRAIESTLAQELDGPFETIVVDDGSTDETREELKLYDGRIRTVLMPANRGLAAARNEGLAAARGEYVAFLDADDEFLPGRLAHTVGALDGGDAVLAYSDCMLVDDVGLMIAPSLAPTMCPPALMRAPSVEDLFSGCWWPIVPSTVTARKDVLEKCHGFDEAFAGASGHEDIYTWFIAREMGPFAFVSRPLAQYRTSPLLDRLVKYLPNTSVLFRLMHERYGAKGALMVHNFAMNMARALVGEGSNALNRNDLTAGRRAFTSAVGYLGMADLLRDDAAVTHDAH